LEKSWRLKTAIAELYRDPSIYKWENVDVKAGEGDIKISEFSL